MSASHPLWHRSLLAAVSATVLVGAAGCSLLPSHHASQSRIATASHSSSSSADPQSKPGDASTDVDESALKPAQEALRKATSAHAGQFAPRIVASARQRITLARDILFDAARADRPLSGDEEARIHKLVQQAQLDARAALAKTQAGAVDYQISRLQQAIANPGENSESSGGSGSGDEQDALGISAYGERQQTPGDE